MSRWIGWTLVVVTHASMLAYVWDYLPMSKPMATWLFLVGCALPMYFRGRADELRS